MNREQPLNGGIRVDQPEPGVRYDGKLIRDMTDAELATYLQRITAEHIAAQRMMEHSVMQHATITAIANVLAFEHERRTKKIRLAGDLM